MLLRSSPENCDIYPLACITFTCWFRALIGIISQHFEDMFVSLEEFSVVSPAYDAFFLLLPFLKDVPLTHFFSSKICVPMAWVFLLLLLYPSVWRKQCMKEMFIQFFLTTTKAAGKFQSYLKEQQSFSKARFIKALMKVGNHPEDRYLNESSALTVRQDSAQLHWWKNQKGRYFKFPVKKKLQFCLSELRDGTVHSTR